MVNNRFGNKNKFCETKQEIALVVCFVLFQIPNLFISSGYKIHDNNISQLVFSLRKFAHAKHRDFFSALKIEKFQHSEGQCQPCENCIFFKGF